MSTQRRYQYLFESSPIPMLDGRPGRIEEVNAAAKLLTRYGKEELLTMSSISLHPSDEVDGVAGHIQNVCSGIATHIAKN